MRKRHLGGLADGYRHHQTSDAADEAPIVLRAVGAAEEKSMRFSIGHFPRSWEESDDEAIIDAITEQSLAADRLGYDAIFLPEHHFHGYCPPSSDLFQMAAYLAPQLKNAWLGASVVVVPLHHPVHLVEKMNLLDHLTKGKVIFGIGSGIHVEEALGFGNNFDQQLAKMSDEALAVAEQLWRKKMNDPPLHFETSRYKGDLFERIVPSPYRKARPRLMGVAYRESSALRAARQGWPVFASYEDGWVNLQRYREALVAANHPADVVAHCMDWSTIAFQGMFVADTDEQAKEEMLQAMGTQERCAQRQLPFIRAAEAHGQVSQALIRIRPKLTDESYYGRWCIWGNPDTVAARIQQFADVGLGNVLVSFNNGLYDAERRERTLRGMELFMKEIVPRFAHVATPRDPREITIPGLDDAKETRHGALSNWAPSPV
jgi:alkanesulfonate monooxygenase SsuD/methylene tetrahydromethanopterin reductase-like flavin-dependent oxidoreductase (luciferase family)